MYGGLRINSWDYEDIWNIIQFTHNPDADFGGL